MKTTYSAITRRKKSN